jgi:2-keto-4-pentenoate hydratase
MNTDGATVDRDVHASARILVGARRAARALPATALAVPVSAIAAYAIQESAIGLWPAPLAGWKVGAVGEPWRSRFGIGRLAGPVFSDGLQLAAGEELLARICPGGFAAVEAEFVFRIGAGVAPERQDWTPETAAGVVEMLHGGVEIASSPLAAINDLGPGAIIADFGNNAGLLVGPSLHGWRTVDLADLRCETRIDGKAVGTGSAAAVPGGPLAGLAFALNHCAGRGRPLQAGQHVCTGATTGIHPVHAGQRAEVEFFGYGTVQCRIEAAVAR